HRRGPGTPGGGPARRQVMKKSTFTQLFMVLLLFSTLVVWASAEKEDGSSTAPISAPAPTNDPTDVAAVRQIGQDMGDAMVAGDIEKLNEIFADDWATIDSSGKIFTKEPLLTDFKSFHDKLEWFENGAIDVQVFGN